MARFSLLITVVQRLLATPVTGMHTYQVAVFFLIQRVTFARTNEPVC